jgi:hypothetical protein
MSHRAFWTGTATDPQHLGSTEGEVAMRVNKAASAVPNAKWAVRTVAAKCHPKSTPNNPTPF